MKLKSCPFCGNNEVIVTPMDGENPSPFYWVMCSNCEVDGPIGDTEEEAVLLWNKRYIDINDDYY